MTKVDDARGRAPDAPAYVAFRTRTRRGLRALFAPTPPEEILIVESDGVTLAVYGDDRVQTFPSFRACLRAHALRGDELDFGGVVR